MMCNDNCQLPDYGCTGLYSLVLAMPGANTLLFVMTVTLMWHCLTLVYIHICISYLFFGIYTYIYEYDMHRIVYMHVVFLQALQIQSGKKI